MTKQLVTDKNIYIDRYDFDGTLDTIIAKLEGLKEAGIIKLDWNTNYDGDWEVTGERYETDEEYEIRLLREKQYEFQAAMKREELKQRQAKMEKETYLRLKAKFEGS